MDIKFHTVFGITVITAKVNIKGTKHYYYAKPDKEKNKTALETLFIMINKDLSIPTYKEFQLEQKIA